MEDATLLSGLLQHFNRQTAQDWLSAKFDSYDPDVGVAELVSVERSLTKDEKLYFAQIEPWGFIKGLPSKAGLRQPLVVAAIQMTRELSDRTSRAKQFALAKKIVVAAFATGSVLSPGTALCTSGLFFFYDAQGNFRLSLVTCGIKGKKLVSTTAKRQSFFCRPEARNNIVKRCLNPKLKSFEDLQRAFSVEGVTKEFYSRLFAWYQWACDRKTGITFPNKIHDPNDDRDMLPEAIIRLITRLMFVWFLREKKLVPDALFDREQVGELLKDFEPNSHSDGTYYRAILQNLFFATLNCPEDKRRFAQSTKTRMDGADWAAKDYRCTTVYRYHEAFKPTRAAEFEQLMKTIPFLNCALFDCLDRKYDPEEDADDIQRLGDNEIFLDGFSRRAAYQAFVPNSLFFYNLPNQAGHEGLIALFDQYEFTVDENTADDADVALDPELLGKVFENLLGAFNPETQEVARNATGSFYTPREIVDYMAEESLKNYLGAKVPAVSKDAVARLFDKNDDTDAHAYLKGESIEALLEALYSCKILDPACGSGAFPMGLLHCMTRLFDKLDRNCTSVRKKIRERYEKDKHFIAAADWMTEKERAERLQDIEDERVTHLHHPDYTRKLFIIENCIYGVDIQPIATQISKLRFFISLLCDQFRENREVDSAGHDHYQLLALPNLEAKFACANTLISLPEMGYEFDFTPEISRLRTKLAAQRRRYFFARSYAAKQNAQKEERQTRREIKAAVKGALSTPNVQEITKSTQRISEYESQLAKCQGEKWQIVKNPQGQEVAQGNLFGADYAPQRIDVNAQRRKELEKSIAAARRKIAQEKAKATQAQSGSPAERYAEQVANWNPYDQNASSPFFDPDWMFGIKDGFDIVIGNPPYISHDQIPADIPCEKYSCYESFADIYCYFYERGLDLLFRDGVLSYITSNSFLCANYGQPLRSYLRKTSTIRKMIDIEGTQIFEGAIVNAVIAEISRAKTDDPALVVKSGWCSDSFHDFVAKASYNYKQENFSAQPWTLVRPECLLLRQKIEKTGKTLEQRQAKIRLGLATGDNHAFILNEEKRNLLLKRDHNNERIIKPVIGGRDIQRYHHAAPQYLLLTKNGIDVVNDFPTVYEYLKTFGDKFRKRGAQGRHWTNLRACAFFDDFKEEKIIWIDLTDRGRFSYSDSEEYLLNSAYFMLPVPGISAKSLLGILNSSTIMFYMRQIAATSGMGTLRWINNYVKLFPIPDVSQDMQENLTCYVDRILAAKKADPEADTSALEAEIDQLVYQLYNLTPEEIAVVDGKSEEKKVEKVDRGRGGKLGTGKVGDRVDAAPVVTPANNDYEELD